MTTTQKTYSLANKPQLIDLNGDERIFNLSFSATSTKGQEFYAVVLDQTMLDTGAEPQFRLTEGGTISANVVSENDVEQNYYLMLKAEKDKPCDVLVTITMSNEEQEPQQSEQSQPKIQENTARKSSVVPKKEKKSGMSKFLMGGIILGVIVIAGAVLYFTVFRKKKDGVELAGVLQNKIELAPSPVPSNPLASLNENLLSKLNKFNLPPPIHS